MTNAAYEHNGQPVSREAFYAIACDPARSVAVEACAGAGKTWMLVSRMLRALLGGAAPHEILAITFTKKAAGEMRQRLQEWLEEFVQAPPDRLVAELIARGVAPQAALDQRPALQGLYRQLLDSGRPVQIRTFHSWFAALLVLPRRMLVPRSQQALQLGFGLLRSHVLFEVFGEPVFLGHKQCLAQHDQALGGVGAGQRIDDGVGRLLRCLVGFGPEGAGPGQPALTGCAIGQCISRVGAVGQLGKARTEGWHRRIHDACLVGQVKLHPLCQGPGQGLVRL